MKHIIMVCALILAGCSTNKDWSGGGDDTNSYQQEREAEQVGNTRDQFPDTKPGADEAQPF